MAKSKMQSNEAKVSDVSAVYKVLAGYGFYFDVRIEPKDGATPGVIAIGRIGDFPWAVRKREPGGSPQRQEVASSRPEEEGFADLLRNLAPYLLTPLTIVWSAIHSSSRELEGAGQWTVWPGSPYVQVQRVAPLPENKATNGHG
jgi:hypothetical protein